MAKLGRSGAKRGVKRKTPEPARIDDAGARGYARAQPKRKSKKGVAGEVSIHRKLQHHYPSDRDGYMVAPHAAREMLRMGMELRPPDMISLAQHAQNSLLQPHKHVHENLDEPHNYLDEDDNTPQHHATAKIAARKLNMSQRRLPQFTRGASAAAAPIRSMRLPNLKGRLPEYD